MIFDPEQMRWYSISAEDDPFADIPDLTTSDPPVARKGAGAGTWNDFSGIYDIL